jgi:hypothetical protein
MTLDAPGSMTFWIQISYREGLEFQLVIDSTMFAMFPYNASAFTSGRWHVAGYELARANYW